MGLYILWNTGNLTLSCHNLSWDGALRQSKSQQRQWHYSSMDIIPFKYFWFGKNSGFSKVWTLQLHLGLSKGTWHPVKYFCSWNFGIFLQKADWYELQSFPSLKSLTAPLSVSCFKNWLSWGNIYHTTRRVVP